MPDTPETPQIIRTRDHGDGIRELRLARPPANALDPTLIAALLAEIRSAPADGARALALSGAPGMFSAGLDVPFLLTLDRDRLRDVWHDFFGLLEALARSPLPIAAAVTGHSPAGGAVLAIFCDWRVMAAGEFKIGLNEVRVGIPLPTAIHGALVRVVGERQAERLGVTGRMISPQQALAVGLVDELAPPEEVVPRAVDWCRELLALPRGPMLETRATARRALGALFDRALEAEVERFAVAWFEEETQAALRAMVERVTGRKV